MPSDYSNTTFSFFIKRDCIELNSYKNYLISPNTGYYSIIDKKRKERQKVICEDTNFKIDQEKFNSIVKKSLDE